MQGGKDNDITSFLDAFDRYTRPFLDNLQSLPVQLKIDHSHRVLENSRKIIKAESLPESIAPYIEIAALFHDIGRFEQFRKYRTFSDNRSLNHAHLGMKIVKKERLLDQLQPPWKNIVISCIGLHNMQNLPKNQSEPLATLCRVVQDSDKIDIFAIMLDHLEKPEQADPTITLDLKPHPTACTEHIVHDVLANKSCAYSEMRWTNDFLLMLASWTNCFHYPTSRKILEQSGSMNKFLTILPKTALFDSVKNHLTP